MTPKTVIFILILISPIVQSYNICRFEKVHTRDRIEEALNIFPKDRSAFMCMMKIAFIEPNKLDPAYTSCVNTARKQKIGLMLKGGTFNIQNLLNMQIGLQSENFRNELASCLNYIRDCYDLKNLNNCLMLHEKL